MKSVSRVVLLSATAYMSVCPVLSYANVENSLFVSSESGIPTHQSHHTYKYQTLERFLSSRLFDDLRISGKEQKIASVCFITDAGNCSGDKFGNLESPTGGNGGGTPNGNDEDIPEYDTIPEQCRDAGYTVTSCASGQHPINPCPSDNTYYKECVCDENLTQTCSVPYYGVGVSCDGKYASCQRDDDKACRNAGYTQTAACPTLQVPNKKCPYNASYYDKCVCQSGLVTCSSPQIGVGSSCDGKYQSCQCPSAYKSCDCGGAVGATSCTINGQTTYSSCKSCCSDTCPSGYSKTNPGGCYNTSRTECGTMCYKSKSCCDSSSSDWCPVHSTCHGDCCKDGTLQPCDTKCGGSGCSSSGSSGSSSGSGSGNTCQNTVEVKANYTTSCFCDTVGGQYSLIQMRHYVCETGISPSTPDWHTRTSLGRYLVESKCQNALNENSSECTGSGSIYPSTIGRARCHYRCID